MKKLIIATLLLFPLTTNAQVTINEIAWMGTIVSANDEWLELYNNGDETIDVSGWHVVAADGSPNVTLSGTIAAGAYFLLERTDDDTVVNVTADLLYSGALGNTGEWLKLTNTAGAVVDEINATDGWPAGDNTTKQTMERTASGWQTSAQPGGTPKALNSFVVPPTDEEDTEEDEIQPTATSTQDQIESTDTSSGTKLNSTPTAAKNSIVITELFPNPAGADSAGEFIELQNASQGIINLTDWVIKNKAGQEFVIPSLSMIPGSIVVFNRTQTSLVLNNTADVVSLYSKTNSLINRIGYKNAPENVSFQQDTADRYQWAPPSAGLPNKLEPIIVPTVIINGPTNASTTDILLFDASDSFDPKNRPLIFRWQFDDGGVAEGVVVQHIFLTPGKHTVTLTALAEKNASAVASHTIRIAGPEPQKPAETKTVSTTTPAVFEDGALPAIFISEFLPNPIGADADGEFIELFNAESSAVNLAGWQLTDNSGGRAFTISATIIQPGEYIAFMRPETNLALNNDNDEIRLSAPGGFTVDVTTYDASKEGVSFVLDEQFVWQESNTPTPGEVNVLDAPPTLPTTTPQVLGVATVELPTETPTNNYLHYIASTLAGLTALGVGAFLKLRK